ncbi:preprotein translocase subunit SecA [Thiomonas sp.]|uniref:preprotein translocase subunit SecA n=1 Tax=Thiomonas sp. TaxID=2047785 RepID=UPI002637E288|nr:preprotein translocase subunit SecA [Thiomonas sp.]
MPATFLTRLFGSRNERLLRQYRRNVQRINALEPQFEKLSDEQLRAKTVEFRERVAAGTTLDEILCEAFAVVREGGKRALKMRHFDVQMIGGMALHAGKIAEMRTGEGKTLVGTLAVYLNALSAKGVHVVTVNDYLAQRDAEWMGRLYRFLGLSVGINLPNLSREDKQAAYAADVTYGTNNEYGFDYLRDNMVFEPVERVQRGLNYALIDEVDSILIDEARTPLIISGQAEDNTELYAKLNGVVPLLDRQIGEEDPITGQGVEKPGDFTVDEKSHQVYLTESGHEKAEEILGRMGLIPPGSTLYDAANIALVHHLYAALRAHNLYHRDQHYVVQGGEVVIVDEFTGRIMAGRRWSDGLHQAVEAKEGVAVQSENQTLASITFQNYFRMYAKLAGMTGTADTEAYEFQEIYNLETVVIPTNRPSQRKDHQDKVYKSAAERDRAVVEDIKDCYSRGQPVLVGTGSIEASEHLAQLLTSEKLPHQVLNAKQHAREAEIVAQAGRPGMITIATNMAGRGTDIVLGGNVEKQCEFIVADENLDDEEKQRRVTALRSEWQSLHDHAIAQGGLHIVGTERSESRRVDNQLRGRSGRQGDPGSSRFYLSLDDPLMRIFAGDRVRGIMERLKMPEGEAIEAGMVTRAIESAQRKVEARNFDIRKQLLEYDDVSNEQRKILYQQRNAILDSQEVAEQVADLRAGSVTDLVHTYVPEQSMEEQWDVPALERALREELQIDIELKAWIEADQTVTDENVLERVLGEVNTRYQAKVDLVGVPNFAGFERMVLLQSLDQHWREHLAALDYLRQGIHLRGYAQKQPKQEYKREAFELFGQMLDAVKNEVTRTLMTVQVQTQEQAQSAAETIEQRAQSLHNLAFQHPEAMGGMLEADDADAQAQAEAAIAAAAAPGVQQVVNALPKVGRNDPCPCGSGKKYKQCHGRLS